ncbi:3-oxoacyl-ACP synthase III family protein [Actinomadura parmotrematis]|uniref:Ketoacyl-ACP synthase III n=1 Tax=Actinomadura parmotrematis TaxID=2864039 RepID=A0ABS7FWR9_9ACTN|nr:ketoacyl-ACP synthase III [Actinomadura parmotrematis]MBW8484032.1 ketoacyl-ACP synthase III [Actinomadura parmotrematis]
MSVLDPAPARAAAPLKLPVPVAIAGTGVHLPETVVTNADLARVLNTKDEWIVRRTGIRERRRLAPGRTASDMGAAAARSALEAAGLDAAELDAIIVSSYTGDQPLPSTALVIKDAIGADRALPLDLTQAACAGGVHALLLAAHLLQGPGTRAVLVIAADCASRVVAPGDRLSGVFFGDAAGAAVLARGDGGAGLLGWDTGSALSYGVQIRAGGSRLPTDHNTVAAGLHHVEMDGREVWDTAVARLPASIEAAAADAGLDVAAVDHFFLHQANLNILHAALDALGVPRDRAPITLDRLGNTGAAGMLTALHETVRAGRLRAGDTYVLSAIGAGFLWGSLCFRHG